MARSKLISCICRVTVCSGCNSMALDFVSRIASDYLMGLGKTARLLADRVSQVDQVSASVSPVCRAKVCLEPQQGSDRKLFVIHESIEPDRKGAREQWQRDNERTRRLCSGRHIQVWCQVGRHAQEASASLGRAGKGEHAFWGILGCKLKTTR